jgi:hypothetical protein
VGQIDRSGVVTHCFISVTDKDRYFFEKSNTSTSPGSVRVSRAALAAARQFILGGFGREGREIAVGHRVDGVRISNRASLQSIEIALIGAVAKYLRAGLKAVDRDTHPILHGYFR